MPADPRDSPLERTIIRDTAMDRTRLRPGTELNGIFVIDTLIAAGGMGEVYRGHSKQTDDKVAIKVIRSDLAESETAIALFRREASALHNLHHEAIARFFLFSVDPIIHRAYLAMEFVEGTSLDRLIADGKPIATDDVAALTRRVALGLQAAHEIGIIHRDISPDNIILAGGDPRKAKIIDFGIARSTKLSNTTVIGAGFAGKYNFVSPEQLGLFDGDVGAASDIYSLGLVVAAILRGKAIDMGGSQVDVINKRRVVPNLTGVDERFTPLITRMLDPDPGLRPQSMLEVAEACQEISGSKTVAPLKAASPATTGRDWSRPAEAAAPAKSSRVPVMLGIVAALAALGGVAFRVLRPAAVAPVAQPNAITAPSPAPAPATAQTQTADASIAPQPTAVPPPKNDAADRTRRFVETFDGGSCFKIVSSTVEPTSTTIEGLGQNAEPFIAMDEAIKKTLGFEANIEFKTVTPSQCAALTFLGRTRFNVALAPRLQVDMTELRNGQSLSGTVSAGRDLQLEVLVVTEDGFVQNITGALRAVDQRTFSVRLDRPASAAQKPQLLIALTATKAIAALKLAKPVHADRFFSTLVSDARDAGIELGAAFQYIVVD